jgi:hypothetical protein
MTALATAEWLEEDESQRVAVAALLTLPLVLVVVLAAPCMGDPALPAAAEATP